MATPFVVRADLITKQQGFSGQSLGTSGKKSATKEKAAKKVAFPEKLPEQVQAIRQQLATSTQPLSAAEMPKRFTKADRVE